MTYDVIIAGAGVAGASAAYWLGKTGQHVLVLEKEALPRYKSCGGGSSKQLLTWFPIDLSPVVEREISHFRIQFREEREIIFDATAPPLIMTMREHLDYHILQQACVDVQDRTTVVALTQDDTGVEVKTRSGHRFRTRYLIGADGANSIVAHLAGLRARRKNGVAIEVEIESNHHTLATYAETALFILGIPYRGYMWIFPKTNHLSAGIGAFKEKAPHLADTLHNTMHQLGIPTRRHKLHGHRLPIYQKNERLHKGRVLLAGDAAGLVDPLLGEGIRYAMLSGHIAAQALLSNDLASYTRRIHREIGDDLLAGQVLAWIFYELPRFSFEMAVRNPWFPNTLLNMLAGKISYRRIMVEAPFRALFGIGRRLPIAAQ